MRCFWFSYLFATAVALAGLADTAAADTEKRWVAILGELEQLTATGEEAELARLDRQTFARLDNAPASPKASELALRLAELRETVGYADPWYALDRARRLRPANADIRFDQRLARGYLLVDLPWRSIEILEQAKAMPTANGMILFEKAKAAIAMIRGDVRTMGNMKGDPYEGRSPLARRALDLLGVPPLAVGGYADLNYSEIRRVPDGGKPGPNSPDFSEKPMLSVLYDKSARVPLSDSSNSTAYRVVQPVELGRNASAIVAQMQKILRDVPRREHEAALLPLLASLKLPRRIAKAEPEQDPDILELLRDYSRNANNIALLSAGKFSDGMHVTLIYDSFNRFTFVFYKKKGEYPPEYNLYLFPSYDATIRTLDVNGEPGDEIIMEEVSGSGGYLNLQVFDPRRSQLTRLVHGSYHGTAAFLNLDTDPALELVASHATGNRRFAPCNQCASRRMALLFDYSTERSRFEAVAQRKTATDTFAQANQNLIGFSPTMFLIAMEEDVEAALERISDRTANSSDEEFLNDARTVFNFVDQQLAASQFTFASDLMDRLLATLAASASGGESETMVRRMALLTRLQALVQLDQPDAVEAAARSADIAKEVADSGAFRASVENFLVIGRLETGAFDEAYQSLDAMTDLVTDESRGILDGNRAHYLNVIGAHQAAYTSALRALDHSSSTDNDHYSAINMIHLAMAAAAAGRTDEAMDWIARAMRLANNLRNSEVASMALSAVVDLLLDRGEADIALRLLDHVIVTTSERVWTNRASAILRQYGKGLAALNTPKAALDALDTAIRFGERRRGADHVAAQLERSRMAEADGNAGAASDYARRAFEGVLDGRARIGVEAHKVSFIDLGEDTAHHHLRLLHSHGASAGEILSAIEDWRLQVFRDVHRSTLPTGDSPGSATGLVNDIVAAVGQDEVFVSYAIGPDVSLAVLVYADGTTRTVTLATDTDEVTTLVATVSRWLSVEDSLSRNYIGLDRLPAELVAALQRLHAILIEPLAIGDGIERLIVSPDRALVGLPWPTLIDPQETMLGSVMEWLGRPSYRFLIERIGIVVLPSVRVHVSQQEENDRRGPTGSDTGKPNALLVGGFAGVSPQMLVEAVPYLSDGPLGRAGLGVLSAGADELRSIEQSLQASHTVSVLLDERTLKGAGAAPGAQATRAGVIERLPAADIVHVAAHGLFNPQTPMESVVFLDTANRLETLTARDFLQTDLSASRLVVLSACQTAASEVAAGSETFGFLRGLMGSGARSVLLTEWSVDDATTAQWFGAFYRELAKNDIAGAARKAALAVRKKRDHPFFWAAPTLYGAWR